MQIKKILVIIQRSNGDVFFSNTLIDQLRKAYKPTQIDLLVNVDTLRIAQTLPQIKTIITFSYKKKSNNRWKQEKDIIEKIYKKYDLSINLTSSDRSVLYAIISSKISISAIESNLIKSWWKRLFLTHYYYFDNNDHILLNNLKPLVQLGVRSKNFVRKPEIDSEIILNIKRKLTSLGISNFMIFHPSAQYEYKIYPEKLRNELLNLLSKSDIPIIVTGGDNLIDREIKKSLLHENKIFDWIGLTSIDEFIALSQLSSGYIGMDTLNMHIAASQNKRIFAIFGPTNLSMWSPWDNELSLSAKTNLPIQTYGNITIFQADMECVACGQKGCQNSGYSKCLDNINPNLIFNNVVDWFENGQH
jgi:heptosyltransferase III